VGEQDVFLQVWIGVDDKLPRQVRAVCTADPLQLRNELELNPAARSTIAADVCVAEGARRPAHRPTAPALRRQNQAAGQDAAVQDAGETTTEGTMIRGLR
jgi:hypothetical protein